MKMLTIRLVMVSAFLLLVPESFALTVNTNDIADGAVTTTKIANGAVTDAKISGPISAAKISSTGLNADTVDGMHASDLAPAVHTHSQSQVTGLEAALAVKSDVAHDHDALYQHKYGKVAVVASTGGDYTDPAAAMSNLGAWCGTPSSANPCLMKIMPGVYTTGFSLADHVDVEGSGRTATTIIGGIAISNAGSVELRDLSVEGQNMVLSVSGGQPTISNVDVRMTNTDNWYNAYAIFLNNSTARFKNVTVSVSGFSAHMGIYAMRGAPSLDGVTVTSSGYGIVMGGGDISVRNSVVESASYGFAVDVLYYGSGILNCSARVYNSTIGLLYQSAVSGATSNFTGSNVQITQIMNYGGTNKCVGCYDGNFDPIPLQ